MPYINMSRFCIICLLANLISGVAQAGGFSMSFDNGKMSFDNGKSPGTKPNITTNRPWGNLNPYTPGLQYPSPQAPAASNYPYASNAPYSSNSPYSSNAPYLGASPGTGWYPGQHTGQYTGQHAATTNPAVNSEPRVETRFIDRGIYEQQNVIYTVRVVSNNNLRTLNPILPNIEGAALEQVDGPVASARQNGRNREIINEYRFKLMPLRAGEITIPPIRFTGTHTNGGGSFSIAADKPLTIHAFMADPAVTPWLPLHELKLQARLSEEGPVKAGIPVTLTLELKARGMLGNQLPSLQEHLQSDGYRAYRDSVTLSSGISKNGKQLLGNRLESYTLIPLQDGPIYLPGMSIAWWDVDTDSPMLTELVSYAPGGAASSARSTATADQSLISTWFWAPLFVALALIAGFWLGALARTSPLLRAAGARLTATRQRLLQRMRTAGSKLSPVPYLNRLRLSLALVMPKTVKLWMCTRCIEQEDNPAKWCQQFRNRVCDHLDITAHTPLPVIAEKLIEAAPQAEAASMRELVHTLDGAIYGTRPVDFPAWKKELRNQLRPRLLGRKWTRSRRRPKAQLPALNPHAA